MVKKTRLPIVFWLAIGLCVFNLHIVDLGENYAARNLLSWAALGACLLLIWRRAVIKRNLFGHPVLYLGLLSPVLGAALVLLVSIYIIQSDWQLSHLFLPFMLLGFALLTLGLLQLNLNDRQIAFGFLIVVVTFLPQYVLHMMAQHISTEFVLSRSYLAFFYKADAGFAQYNLMGSFIASLLVFGGFVVSRYNISSRMRWTLISVMFLYMFEVPTMNSKTGILGLYVGLGLLLVHQLLGDQCKKNQNLLWTYLSLFPLAYFAIFALQAANPAAAVSTADWQLESNSVKIRSTMWLIAWRSFLEAPLFGHGLGSFVETYNTHFARYGVYEGLYFIAQATIPHNLVMHVLSVSGLFGATVLLGPLIYLAVYILRRSRNRWLIAALAFPVVLHSQTEYPYVSSGLHYMTLAAALALGLRYRSDALFSPAVISNPRVANIAYASISFLAICLIVGSLHLMHAYAKASKKYYLSRRLSFEDFLTYSYVLEEPFHPVFERRLRAITDMRAINLAIKGGRYDFLDTFGVRYLDENVLPYYQTPGNWYSAAHVYKMLGRDEKLLQLMSQIDSLDPAFAEELRDTLRNFSGQQATGHGRVAGEELK